MATAKQLIKALRITARPDVFFRAGRRFTAEARTIPLSELAPTQIKALKAEPKLITVEVDVDPADLEGKAITE